VSLARLQGLRWDEDALLVHADAGWNLGALEEKLNAHDYTLGHAPQSLYLATVGGCVATNAVGLLSGKYGRQADLTLALEAVLPTGEIVRTPAAPGASAGPDLGRLFLGAEGTLGIITEATMRMWPLPDVRAWAAFTFPGFYPGADALRHIYRTDARPAAVRLFDPAAAGDLLVRNNLPPGAALLLLAFEGDELPQTGQYQMAHAVCQKAGGTERAPEIGEAWFEERLQTGWMAPNARPGGLADVIAVSASWPNLRTLYDQMRAAVSPLVTQLHGHIGHAYPTGAALDLTFQAQAEPATPEEATALHRRTVAAAMEACIAAGGSIAHHYGVGLARRDWMAAELGEAGLLLLRRIKAALDPNNILNPGKLGIGGR
jgi:alkyldihydroxyacetonephosphate synthase